MSTAKRFRYVSDDMSSSDEDFDAEYSPSSSQKENSSCNGYRRNPTRKPKVFSKNAMMARENRLKKKLYLESLENDLTKAREENKKLSTVVDNQSFLIADLKKQIKYLKSVVANSNDLGKLIRNIHHSTGMSVSTSLDKTLSLNSQYVPKRSPPIARKTAHPWDELDQHPNCMTPESIENSPPVDYGLSDDFSLDFLNSDVPLGMPTDLSCQDMFNSLEDTNENTLKEHDYVQNPTLEEDDDDDVGVCLHVSKHRVSLEFCSTCSDNAQLAWSS
ncbi:uncharacterized protein LOC109594424 [Aethina tumida]|uniref:uncharacterized protein LOC109594424 n=1 Tax=Aethina tumida TaxID=116153 RepID=UPI0021483CDF|nr:uncharacterized protein LOC109594424 [Aethina tumida]XP_049820185.1 uncharacterized protein LOC109594424 [Aethina tumida]XP_049820186.1 uncharacterized protein LOC109594424 [Aethina tumida]XP_049820187.1 uncharacterized protein LOC109594424 [Aethina tumida]